MRSMHPLQLVGLALIALGVGVLILSMLLGLGSGLGAIFIVAGVPTFIMGTIGAFVLHRTAQPLSSPEGTPVTSDGETSSEERKQ